MLKRPFVIRCPIYGSIELTALEKKIIDHPFIQRLRNISQLGLGVFVYPSATHNRFTHSLGVLHLADRFWQTLAELQPSLKDLLGLNNWLELRQILRLTSLLHDIGHIPFSHTLEQLFPPLDDLKKNFISLSKDSTGEINHEHFSILLIQELNRQGLISTKQSLSAISLISGQLQAEKLFVYNNWDCYWLLLALINSEIDVDRMDYLLRDSYFTGVSYGQFDIDHLCRSVAVHIPEDDDKLRLILLEGGILSFEDMLSSRRLMFAQVYFHRTLLSMAQLMLKAIEQEEIKISLWDSLTDYVENDDITIFNLIKTNKTGYWCQKIKERKPLKTVLRLNNPQATELQKCDQILALLTESKFEFFYSQRKARFFHPKKEQGLLVQKRSPTKFKFIPIEKLIEHVYSDINIWQLNVEQKNYEQVQKMISDIF